MDRYARPLAILAIDEPVDRDFADRILKSAGWRTSAVQYGKEGLTHINSPAAIILVSCLNSGLADENFADARTSFPPAIGRVPIIGWVEADKNAATMACDDILPKPSSPDQLIAMVERWRPQALPEAFGRLQAAFGEVEAMSLLERFRQLLLDAEAALATDRPRELAHRVAGMAGMLGFTELGQQWLSLSENEGVDVGSLRRATLRAIVAIDHAAAA